MSRTVQTDVDRTLAALADPTRRLVLLVLIEHPVLCDTATKLTRSPMLTHVTRQAIVKHLQALEAAEVVSSTRARTGTRDARERRYTVRTDRLCQLALWLQGVIETIDESDGRALVAQLDAGASAAAA